MPFACGLHRAVIYARGGTQIVRELTPLSAVRWQRIRDDVSVAEIRVPTQECCEALEGIHTIKHELHILRNDVTVWQGPITRLEFEFDETSIFAADVLWQSTRTVLDEGYDQSSPNIGLVIDRMDWLLRTKTYTPFGDPWNVLPHLHPMHSPGEPRTSRIVNPWQFYVWEDLDKYAEDYGADYCVVNRDIFYFDIHYAWKIIPPLDERYLSQFPRVVEYGNQLATRGVVTNGQGFAGTWTAPATAVDEWGLVDWLVTNTNDGQQTGPPTADELAGWSETAGHNIADRYPPPVSIIVPENTTLMPGGPWEIEDLVPGAWFQITTSRVCRTITEWQRIHEIVVTETAPEGEMVAFTATAAPAEMVMP